MAFYQSFGLKIIVFVIAILAVYAYVDFKIEEKQILDSSKQTAELLSISINTGLSEAMVEGKAYKVQKMIESYGSVKNINKIRIFNPDTGSILQDSDRNNIGNVIDKRYISLLKDINDKEQVLYDTNGKKIFSVVTPIINSPKCYQCHDSRKQVLGALDIDMLVIDTFSDIAKIRLRVIQFALLAAIGISLVIVLLYVYLFNRPVKKLVDTIDKVEAGNLMAEAHIPNVSEFGKLTKSFNSMVAKIRTDIERLEALHKTARDIRSTNNLNEIEYTTVQGIVQGLGFDRVALLLVNENDNSEKVLEGRVGIGIAKDIIDNIKIPLDREYGILVNTILDARTFNVKMGMYDACLVPERDVKCWEFYKCTKIECPAYYSDDLACWIKSPTLCRDNVQLSFKEKTEVCCKCPVIQEAYGKKADLVLMMFGSESFVTVPLMTQNEAIGLIMVDNLHNKRPITDEDIKGLSIFANQAGMAIENARLYKKLEGKIEVANEELRQKIVALTEMQNFNDSILQNMSNGLITIDVEGKITYFNSSAEMILGYKAQEVKGRQIKDLFGVLASFAAETIRENKRFVFHETNISTKSGSNIPIEVSTLLLKNDANEVTRVVLIITNLTERREMEKQIRRADKMATIGQLAAGIAHEIRNPLAGISGAVQILADDTVKTDPRREILDEIIERIKRLNDAISNFLQFARPAPLQLSPTDINEVIQSVLFLINSQSETQGVSIFEEYDDNVPIIMADSEQLQQVILNIAINALQAIGENDGKTPKSIRFKTFQDIGSSQIVVEISDTGVGISAEKLEQIFNPYFTTKSEGTGLGLSIAQRIIEEHQGTITVKSQVGKGTTFRMGLRNG